MQEILILASTFIAAGLTFFTGFGLGSVLLPIYIACVGPKLAVGVVALIHLANNLLKVLLTARHANKSITLRFGLPAMAASCVGAWILSSLPLTNTWSIQLFGWSTTSNGTKLVIGVAITVLSIIEILARPSVEKTTTPESTTSTAWLLTGGLLSGFFGGLSGHQGAFRTMFLLRLSLSKEALIATGAIIACLVDLSRLGFYFTSMTANFASMNALLLAAGLFGALAGTAAGNRFLKKISLPWLERTIAFSLCVFGVCLSLGMI